MVAVLWRCRCARVLSGCCSTGALGAACAVLCAGLPAGPGCLWPHGCSGCRMAWPPAPRAFGSARRLVVRPGPATAHGHRRQALRSLRHPPYRWWWGFCSIRRWLSACRRRVVVLMTPFPRLVVVRPRREAVRAPNCRPIGWKQSKIGHFEAMGLYFGGIGECKRVG